MKQILGFLFLIHSAISLSRYRKHMQQVENTIEFQIPIDILFEIILGCILNFVFGVLSYQGFEDIHTCNFTDTLDKTFSRPNFKNLYFNKTYLMPSYFKQLSKDKKFVGIQK